MSFETHSLKFKLPLDQADVELHLTTACGRDFTFTMTSYGLCQLATDALRVASQWNQAPWEQSRTAVDLLDVPAVTKLETKRTPGAQETEVRLTVGPVALIVRIPEDVAMAAIADMVTAPPTPNDSVN
jgi:hypothetical protein